MKRAALFLVLFLLVFVSADNEASIGEEDVKKIQGTIDDNVPIDPNTGEVDFDKYKPFWTKADERIAKINEYVGPITKTLFGVELTLSWIFVFSVVLWILLIELLLEPTSQIFDWNFWWSLLGSTIIATLAMQGFGKDFVVWVDSIVTAWYIGLVALLFGALFYVLYHVIMRYLGQQVKGMKEESEKAKLDQDKAVIHADAEVSEKRLKSFSYTPRMRRGGDKGERGRFVSKKSVDRYSKMFGDEAAEKRFGGK